MNLEKGYFLISLILTIYVSALVWVNNSQKNIELLIMVYGNTMASIAGYLQKNNKDKD